jgi:glycosyltransferase involved in cell wall biosynthesis
LRRLIREQGFDIVHCHQYTPFFYGVLASSMTSSKLVFTEHGRFYPDRYRYKALFINPILALLTSGLVAISEATRLALARYEFMPIKRIQVIYNGIRGLQADSDEVRALRGQLGLPAGAFIVGTVSRLDKVKNQEMMLRAFARFRQVVGQAWLLLVGDGPEREHLERLAEQLGIADQVKFVGFIREPANYLALMDIFLLSSHTEGTSMTLLEAMSLGVPIVATQVGGNPEIVVNGETGLLTAAGEEHAFSEAMLRIYRDPQLRSKLAEAGLKRFEDQFSVEKMTKQYVHLYHRVLQG